MFARQLPQLFIDDLGYGDVSFTGHPTTHTPNLESLALGGMRLTSWYSGAALCSASRAALMTGRQFPRSGTAPVFGPTANYGMWTNETTVAQQVKKEGDATAIVGKVGEHTLARVPPLMHLTLVPWRVL